MQDTILKLIGQAQEGDQSALEELVREHRPFIQKVTGQICKRKVYWDKDDELSIALIAFHEAVEKYVPDKGAQFSTFSYKVIQQRLIDYFRKEKRQQHLPLRNENEEEADTETSKIERDKAMAEHLLKKEQQELAETMEEFEQRLVEFGISMEDLVDASPKHRDTRENLLQLAKMVSKDEDLLSHLKKKKKLPAKDIIKRTKVSRKVLESSRKYLIALIIIITESPFSLLKDFGGIKNE